MLNYVKLKSILIKVYSFYDTINVMIEGEFICL